MFKPFYIEEQVKLDDESTLRLVFNFRAIDALETLVQRQADDIASEVLSGAPRLGVMGKVLWALMREHHADATLDDAAGLMFNEETSPLVGAAVGLIMLQAFSHLGPPEKAKGKNPRKRRGASKNS